MKTTIKTLLITIVFAGMSMALQAQKIGYINSDAIIAALPETKTVLTQLESYKGELDKKIQDKVVAFQQRYSQEQQRLEKGMLTPIQQQEIQASLQQEQDSIIAFENEQATLFDTRTKELYQPIFDKVNKAIETVSQANGYNLVLDTKQQVIIYSDGSANITRLVAENLGLKFDQN